MEELERFVRCKKYHVLLLTVELRVCFYLYFQFTERNEDKRNKEKRNKDKRITKIKKIDRNLFLLLFSIYRKKQRKEDKRKTKVKQK